MPNSNSHSVLRSRRVPSESTSQVFSSSLQLAQEYLTPSAVCILPPKVRSAQEPHSDGGSSSSSFGNLKHMEMNEEEEEEGLVINRRGEAEKKHEEQIEEVGAEQRSRRWRGEKEEEVMQAQAMTTDPTLGQGVSFSSFLGTSQVHSTRTETAKANLTNAGGSRTSRPTREGALKITLQDCLACNGCITSAESILVESQSSREWLTAIGRCCRERVREGRLHPPCSSRMSPPPPLPREGQPSPGTGPSPLGEGEHVGLWDTRVAHDACATAPFLWLVTLSEASAVSFAAYWEMTVEEAYERMAGFLSLQICQQVKKTMHALAVGMTNGKETMLSQEKDDEEEIERNEVDGFSSFDATMTVEEAEAWLASTYNMYIQITDLRWAQVFSVERVCEEYMERLRKANKIPNTSWYRQDHANGRPLNTQDTISTKRTISMSKYTKPFCGKELKEKENKSTQPDPSSLLPLIVSSCPGWCCYCEKQGEELIALLSKVLSAQGIAGSYIKRQWQAMAASRYRRDGNERSFCTATPLSTTRPAEHRRHMPPTGEQEAIAESSTPASLDMSSISSSHGSLSSAASFASLPPLVYHLSVQPCFDKKLEASRDVLQFVSSISTTSIRLHEAEVTKHVEQGVGTSVHATLEGEWGQRTATKKENLLSFWKKDGETSASAAASSPLPSIFCTDCVLSTVELLEWMIKENNTIDEEENHEENGGERRTEKKKSALPPQGWHRRRLDRHCVCYATEDEMEAEKQGIEKAPVATDGKHVLWKSSIHGEMTLPIEWKNASEKEAQEGSIIPVSAEWHTGASPPSGEGWSLETIRLWGSGGYHQQLLFYLWRRYQEGWRHAGSATKEETPPSYSQPAIQDEENTTDASSCGSLPPGEMLVEAYQNHALSCSSSPTIVLTWIEQHQGGGRGGEARHPHPSPHPIPGQQIVERHSDSALLPNPAPASGAASSSSSPLCRPIVKYMPQRNRNHQVVQLQWPSSTAMSDGGEEPTTTISTTIHVAHGFQHIQNVVRQLRKKKKNVVDGLRRRLPRGNGSEGRPPRVGRPRDVIHDEVEAWPGMYKKEEGEGSDGRLAHHLTSISNPRTTTKTTASFSSLRERLTQLRQGKEGPSCSSPATTATAFSSLSTTSSSSMTREIWEDCTFLEIMACPDGCWNGGGQLPLALPAAHSSSASSLASITLPSSTTTALDRVLEKAKTTFLQEEEVTHTGAVPPNPEQGVAHEGTCGSTPLEIPSSPLPLHRSAPHVATMKGSSSSLSSSLLPFVPLVLHDGSPRGSCTTNTSTKREEVFPVPQPPAKETPKEEKHTLHTKKYTCVYAFSYSVDALREVAVQEEGRWGKEEGNGMWRCVFKDRQAEFKELLDKGGVHTLQW